MIALVAIGVALGLDSFQVSLGLGLLRPTFVRQAALALAFLLCDGLAPLVGLAIGQSLAGMLHAWVEYAGPGLIGLYGVYMICVARYGSQTPSAESERWALLGLPVCLSVDNLVAGVGLGMLGFPLLLSAGMLGSLSAALSLGGLWLGRTIANRLPFKAEFASGAILVLVAGVRVADWF